MSAFQYQENGGGKVKGSRRQMMGIRVFPVIHSIGKAATTTNILTLVAEITLSLDRNQVGGEGDHSY